MEFVRDTLDLGTTKEFFCSGIARIEIIDGEVIRVTIYTEQNGEKIETVRLTWTVTGWRRAREDAGHMAEELERLLFSQPPERVPRLAPH